MRNALLATAALLATVALAAPASAALPVVTLSNAGDAVTLPFGQSLVADFNNPAQPEAVAAGYTLDLDGATVGVNEGGSGYSGTIDGDNTHYLTIPGNASATLTSLKGLKSFSFYLGSPDSYNKVQFIGLNGYNETLSGGGLSGGYVGQSWGWGQRVNFDFGNARVTQVILTSSGNSFEIDNFAAAAVPEPATWAMMIMGFGAVGAMVRRRRPVMAGVAA